MRAIGQLQDQGIVTAASEAKRSRLFCAKALRDKRQQKRPGDYATKWESGSLFMPRRRS